VADCSDPRRLVYVLPDIALSCYVRCAGVQTHADMNRMRRKGPLRVGGCRSRIACSRESHEERVTLGVHLDAVVSRAGLPKQPLVLAQRFRVSLCAELLQQLR
jgi:hypothetical protein